mmetsp:Transcript_44917/g.137162  ORF Transcript_44917/g.137162 Transcript_44917/m.137162 type:complete len:147 (-) Transcript_44917:767-1207(-)
MPTDMLANPRLPEDRPGQEAPEVTPPRVYRHCLEAAVTPLEEAKAHLAAGPLFFACRFCEYTKVGGTRRTQTIRLQDLKFRKGKRVLRHLSRFLHLADTTSITFHLQKNDKKGETVTMHRTSESQLNPVTNWAFIVRRIMKIEGWN